MLIHLIRHGETKANKEKILCGQLDTRLTIEAVQQLKSSKVPSLIKKMSQKFTLFSSPLSRCLETSELLFPDTPPQSAPLLMETNTGDYSTLRVADVHKINPDFQLEGLNFDLKYPNGESCHDVHNRMSSWITNNIESKATNSDIVIVCHAGTINHFASILLGVKYSGYPTLHPQNGSLTTFEYLDKPIKKYNLLKLGVMQ